LRQIVLSLVLLCSLGATALAGVNAKKVDLTKLPCSNETSCIKKCSAKAPAACDRLTKLIDSDLNFYRDPHYTLDAARLDTFTRARTALGPVCDAGVKRACVLLGRLEEQGRGGPADIATATTRFTSACNAGEGVGCLALGHAQEAGTIIAGDRGLDSYNRGCTAGNQDACAEAAMFALNDGPTGLATVGAACDAGSARACESAGILYHDGFMTTAADRTLAQRYLDRGCELGSKYSCETADDDEDRDYTKACYHAPDVVNCSIAANTASDDDARRELTDRACRLGDLDDCKTHAALYAGKNDKKSRAIVAADFTRACDAGHDWACVEVFKQDVPGIEYNEKLPKKVSPAAKKKAKQALARLETMCADNSERSCYLVGRIYQFDVYVPRDLPRALTAIRAYCTLSASTDCYEATELESRIAFETDQKACGTGDLAACERFGRSYLAEPKAAKDALTKACDGHVASACAALAYEAVASGDAEAAAIVLASCKAGTLADCEYLAMFDNVPAANEEAGRQGCALGSASLCVSVGSRTGNESDAFIAFTRACQLDATSDGCAERDRLAAGQHERDDDAACVKHDGAACMRVGDRKAATVPAEALAAYRDACGARLAEGCTAAAAILVQTGQRDQAITLWVTACTASVAGACGQAAPYLRPTDPKDKGTAQYRDVLDRGCAQGDTALCDEAKFGYAPPVVAPETVHDTTAPTRYDGGPHRKRFAIDGRLEGGLGSMSRTSQPTVSAYFAGLDLRGRTAGKTSLVGMLRASIAYDAQKKIGFDGAAGLGLDYALGPIHLEALGLGGRDAVGDARSGDPTILGVLPATYVGFVAGGWLQGGSWNLGLAWDKLYRGGEPDESRFALTVDLRRSSKRFGLGLRKTSFADDANTKGTSFFAYLGW
jgi:TPR repeat protein